MKHPPITGYVGQANIADGLQQMNNAAAVRRVTRKMRKTRFRK